MCGGAADRTPAGSGERYERELASAKSWDGGSAGCHRRPHGELCFHAPPRSVMSSFVTSRVTSAALLPQAQPPERQHFDLDPGRSNQSYCAALPDETLPRCRLRLAVDVTNSTPERVAKWAGSEHLCDLSINCFCNKWQSPWRGKGKLASTAMHRLTQNPVRIMLRIRHQRNFCPLAVAAITLGVARGLTTQLWPTWPSHNPTSCDLERWRH